MTQNSSQPPELPPGFRSVDQIKSLPGRPLVNFIGFLKDYRQPMKPFSGSDFKCTLELKDSYDQSIDLVIFWPEKSMPRQPSSAGCAVLLRNVKVGIPKLLLDVTNLVGDRFSAIGGRRRCLQTKHARQRSFIFFRSLMSQALLPIKIRGRLITLSRHPAGPLVPRKQDMSCRL